MIVAVPHKEVLAHSLLDFEDKLNAGGCFIDVKSQFDPKAIKEAGFCVWRL
jgi:UDP-N-acetyl-D-galactosamine dehydrogenase